MHATTVDIQGTFLNAHFTSDDKPIYLRINKDIVSYWILQDPSTAPYITEQVQMYRVQLYYYWTGFYMA